MVPIAYGPNDDKELGAVCYDDIESVMAKTYYAKTNNLAGVSMWSLDMDDFTGLFCMQGRFPLIQSARDILFNQYENTNDDDNNNNNKVSFYSNPISNLNNMNFINLF
jgi:GH18 family chitinase